MEKKKDENSESQEFQKEKYKRKGGQTLLKK